MEPTIHEQIQAASSHNTTLLAGLHRTDSAPAQFAQQVAYIADLDSQIKQTSRYVSNLKAATASELKDHKKYSESTFRRFAHKASGKKDRFEEKAAKEEREYFDAIQEQKTGEDQLAYLEHLKAEAEKERQKYYVDAQHHIQLQRELDALYDSIFAGPTPGFPDEDEKERACTSSSEIVQRLSQQLEHERHVLFLLGQVSAKLTEAARHLNSAHSASQMDMFGGGTLSSMQKRNYLERGQSSISSVKMLQAQLRRISPETAEFGEMDIASGSIWGDVVFDNIFSDMDMHVKIKESEVRIERAGQRVGNAIRRAEGREKESRRKIDAASARLQNARGQLQTAREDAFARVLAGQVGAQALEEARPPQYELPEGAPPAYSA